MMTLKIELPPEAVKKLEAEAVRKGTPIDVVIADAIMEHLKADPQELFDQIAARVPAHSFVKDLSRETIYAE